MSTNKDIANIYFLSFSQSNIAGVRTCLSDDVSLRDWELDISGIESVLSEFLNIFRSLSNLTVDILNLYEIDSIIVAELIITANEIGCIKVVDILSFNENRKICSIRAYKG